MAWKHRPATSKTSMFSFLHDIAKPLAEISKTNLQLVWPTKIILYLVPRQNQLSVTSVLIDSAKPAWRLQTKWYGKLCRSVVQGEQVGTESFFFHEGRYFYQFIQNMYSTRTHEVWQFWLAMWHVKAVFFLGTKKSFKLRNLPSRTSTLFPSWWSTCPFLSQQSFLRIFW